MIGPATLLIGDSSWLIPAVAIAVLGIVFTLVLRRGSFAASGMATLLRVIGWLLITACIVNPLWSSTRPRQGANVFAVVVDNSRSQTVIDTSGVARSDQLTALLEQGERSEPRGWLHRLDEQFELRRYTLSDHLQRTPQLASLQFHGQSSRLQSGLDQLADQFRNQPLAGILLLTDGNATDRSRTNEVPADLPPVYPVIVSRTAAPPDVAIDSVTVSQSAFDDAPVTLQVAVRAESSPTGRIRTTLLDDAGTPLESQTQPLDSESPLRFNVRPETAGTVFYRLQAELLDADGTVIDEATAINNTRLVAVDRGSQARRVLYVSGRPNWEFKFLRRAIETDARLEITALIRIARKEAKFEFRGRTGERSNSLFRGFDEAEQEVAEDYDEPVMVRLGTRDDDELISGFPEDAAELFVFDGLILDDIEADFFTTDQQMLIRDFVSRRGAGLLMLGGQESFRQGEYDRTPVGEMLPLDLRSAANRPAGPVRLSLTRDGWLQPWVRLRSEEAAEQKRLDAMPAFRTLNTATRIRPGAQIMASISDETGSAWPALVVQRFGRGRSGAVCIGDLWRWRLHEGRRPSGQGNPPAGGIVKPGDNPEEDRGDFARAARQMIRWLVSDVPQRITVESSDAATDADSVSGSWRVSARVRGNNFEPREDADVRFVITRPDGTSLQMNAQLADDEVGRYDALVPVTQSGAWQCEATATLHDPDEKAEELTTTHGWTYQPDQQEMASVQINVSWLQSLADATNGRIVAMNDLPGFVDDLETSDAPVMEVLSWPVWHQWSVFLVALACFAGDWTIRRRLGYP